MNTQSTKKHTRPNRRAITMHCASASLVHSIIIDITNLLNMLLNLCIQIKPNQTKPCNCRDIQHVGAVHMIAISKTNNQLLTDIIAPDLLAHYLLLLMVSFLQLVFYHRQQSQNQGHRTCCVTE